MFLPVLSLTVLSQKTLALLIFICVPCLLCPPLAWTLTHLQIYLTTLLIFPSSFLVLEPAPLASSIWISAKLNPQRAVCISPASPFLCCESQGQEDFACCIDLLFHLILNHCHLVWELTVVGQSSQVQQFQTDQPPAKQIRATITN